MRYLVTGGAGFIGSHIVRRLELERNAEVVVLDNLSVGSRRNVPSNCRLVEGDINDAAALGRALEGVAVVFHLAAFVSIRGSFERPEADLRDNCQGMLSVFRKAGECGVRRVVFASSMGVYGEPKRLPVSEDDPAAPVSPYGLSKLRGEMYGKSLSAKYGYSFIALRYFNTYGAGQTPSDYVGVLTSFINMALDSRPLTIYGDGTQTRDLVWVEDIAEASVLAAQSKAEGIFNIGSGTEVSINELARAVQECISAAAVHVAAPAGEIRRMCADISRARGLLGYSPSGKLAEQLPSIVDYWRRKKTNAVPARRPANV
jgi:UDP-glucose 4-epimerase